MANGSTSVYADVNTTGCSFTATPVYTTSLTGTNNHYLLTGTSSLYGATSYGFRIYVNYPAGVTPTQATSWGWNINWVALGT